VDKVKPRNQQRELKNAGYEAHFLHAEKQWKELNMTCYQKKYPNNNLRGYYDELEYIVDHFSEMEQVKIIWSDYDHCLKIKWENWSCWWADCDCLGFYYCVLLPIDDVRFWSPYDLGKERLS
tara:strand:- start:2197 stop:2562 length:366 start_codon:yes stop_codon:yes gene_type:complete